MARITLTRSSLTRPLALLNNVIDRRLTIPVLGMVKVSPFGKNQVALEGTDLERQIICRVDVERDGDVPPFLIPLKLLKGAHSGAGEIISIEIDSNLEVLKITADAMTLTVRSHMPVDDFPIVNPSIDMDGWRLLAAGVTLAPSEWKRIITKSLFCASQEPNRYYLHGLHITTKPDATTVRVVATDGHRMAIMDTETTPNGSFGDESIIVPTPTVETLKLALGRGDGNEPVEARFGKFHAEFVIGNTTLRTKLIDGTYPNYMRVVPDKAPEAGCAGHITLNRLGFGRFHKIATALISERTVVCRFDIETARMTVKGLGAEDEISAPVQARCEDGFKVNKSIGFNLRYIKDLIDAEPTVTMTGDSAESPMIARGEDPLAMWIQMPMRV
ncbi:hypothetical protein [Maritimibacter sp. DP1N21-5]|uniref:DNA polymerase III subunit beta n=1 Tax=Maritimibacter sp. DP1N21-5 TaxID=2836867 RepID=UPI001C452866|nr:hypothetical protein [Maritimibacter sp. DP1N21-5]MBV7408728.1 hypothetical protein [Maritimibacter sp. DP1N21-5]